MQSKKNQNYMETNINIINVTVYSVHIDSGNLSRESIRDYVLVLL